MLVSYSRCICLQALPRLENYSEWPRAGTSETCLLCTSIPTQPFPDQQSPNPGPGHTPETPPLLHPHPRAPSSETEEGRRREEKAGEGKKKGEHSCVHPGVRSPSGIRRELTSSPYPLPFAPNRGHLHPPLLTACQAAPQREGSLPAHPAVSGGSGRGGGERLSHLALASLRCATPHEALVDGPQILLPVVHLKAAQV